MKTSISLLAFAFATLLIASCTMDAPLSTVNTAEQVGGKILAAPAGKTKVPDHYIVLFADDVDANDIDNEILRLKGKHNLEVTQQYKYALRGFSSFIPPGQLAKLAADSRVKRIEEDFIVEVAPITETAVKKGGGSTNPAQVVPWGITNVGGPFNGSGLMRPTGGSRFMWIIDTGIDPNTNDLNIITGLCKNFVSTSNTWNDGNGHGTHVAGTIGALNNTINVVGVAYGANLVAVRVLDSRGSGQMSWVLAGVNYVAQNGGASDVANMSLGGGFYQTLNDAIFNASLKGIYFALAAGNESTDCSAKSPASTPNNGGFIYTVSAHSNDAWASFSNYGTPVDVCAPGVNVISLKPGGGVTTMSGTSMATPHVAGLLYRFGNIDFNATKGLASNGRVINDPDGIPDPLAWHY